MTKTASAGQQLEAFFVRQILAETRPQGGAGLGGGGFAGDTFKGMMDEAIADQMSAAGGVGLAQLFDAQLPAQPGTTATRSLGGAGARGPAASLAFPAPPSGGAEARGPAASLAFPGPSHLAHDLAAAPHLVAPVVADLGSGYGHRADQKFGPDFVHKGLDLHAPLGAEVHAAADGVVTHAGRAGSYGNLVTIRHANGYETRYAHLSAVDVHEGDHVTPGQDVGKVGSTGNSALPHLHFELRKAGYAIDPEALLPNEALHGHPTRPNR